MLRLSKKFLFLFLLMPKFLWHVKQYVVCLGTAYGVFFFFFFYRMVMFGRFRFC
jgi:hypothetical protein